MRRSLRSILTAVLLLALCACGAEEGPESAPPETSPSVQTPAASGEQGPQTPPALLVRYGDRELTALRGTSSWHQREPGGPTIGVESEGIHPLEAREVMPLLSAAEGELWLVLDPAPDALTVRAWPVSCWGDPETPEETAVSVPVSGNGMRLLEGGHIYEVFAEWTRSDMFGGSVHYSFCTSPLGVELSAENVTPTGLTLVCTQSGGMPTGELQTGSPYRLEARKGRFWRAVETVIEEPVWTMEAWGIPMNAEVSWEVNWEALYGELPAGEYRIKKEIMDFRGAGDWDSYDLCAEFIVE